jgi:uracil-DNA glycosylase
MPTWSTLLTDEQQLDYFKDTLQYIANKRANKVIVYPPDNEVFSALTATPFQQVKVVILGQDPYHGENQAHGLSFSVKKGIKIPPSLRNIYKELSSDIDGFILPEHGYLQSWAEQGVLLLNTVLTVEQGQAHSHKHLGWEQYSDKIIQLINDHLTGVVFLLWGSHAQKKGKNINTEKHTVLKAPHPSPLSAHRGFLGCQHFSKTNKILTDNGQTAINWHLL